MAFRRPLAPLVTIALALLSCLAATAKQTGQLTVFWGRNAGEDTLREACDTGLYSTVVISFYSVFGHGRYWGDLSGHPLSGVGADIKHCQSSNILVLLSIGGPGNVYSLPTFRSAADVADNLWNAHLGGRRAGVFRPFGDAAVDGIDFHIDRGGPDDDDGDRYAELARRLDGYNRFYRGRKGVRLTATPRCGFPADDRRLEAALRTGLFERIHVRFYGNDTCALVRGGTYGVALAWERWAAAFPAAELYLGLAPAESGVPEGAQGTVAVYLKYLYYNLLPKVQKARNYAGVMVWDRFADKKTRWSGVVKGWA